MNVMINGEAIALDVPVSLQGLIQDLKVDIKNIAITVNNNIVPKSRWHEVHVNAGDDISLFQAIAGG